MSSKPDKSRPGASASMVGAAPTVLDGPGAASLYSEAAVRIEDGASDSLDPLHTTTDLPDLIEVADENYEIGNELARGGMGRIMEGRDRRAGRPVAIKEVLSELLKCFPEEDRQILLRRFEREARITAGLQHPAIVPVYEIGRFGDMPFFAMKKVRGRPLDKAIAELGSLSERLTLLPKLIAIADALAYAHERGVIHRDLKPANVLVGAHGETVVIDWGLAKQLTDVDDAPSQPPVLGTDDGLRTVAGSVFGTPHYMPPEQASGIPTDRTADVYAIGAMLYHLLAGFAPYQDGAKKRSASAVLDALKEGAPTPLADLDEGVPKDLVSIVEKAMSRKRRERYESAAGLAEDLRQFQAGALVTVHEYSARELLWRWIKRHQAAVATGVIALLLVIGVAAFSFVEIRAERDRAKLAATDAKEKKAQAVRILTEGGQDALLRADMVDAAFRLIQAAKLGSTKKELPVLLGMLMRSMSPRVTRIHSPSSVRNVAATGSSPLFAISYRDGRVEIRNASDAQLVIAFQGPQGTRRISFSADVSKVLFHRVPPLTPELWDARTGTLIRTLNCEKQRASTAVLTPDGQRILLLCSGNKLIVLDTETGERLGEMDSMIVFRQLDVSQDSKTALAGIGGYLYRYNLEPVELISKGMLDNRATHYRADAKLTIAALTGGSTLRIFDFLADRNFSVENRYQNAWQSFRISGDGSAIAASDDGGRIVIMDRAGKHKRTIQALDFVSMALNPDGSLLAEISTDGLIRIWDIDSGRLRSSHIGVSTAGPMYWLSNDRLLALDGDRGALLIRAEEDWLKASFDGAGKPITQLSYNSEGFLLGTLGSDLVVFDRDLDGPLGPPKNLGEHTLALRQGPQIGPTLATQTGIFDVSTGELVVKAPPSDDGLKLSGISRDGSTAVLASGKELIGFSAIDGRVLRRYAIPNPRKLKYMMTIGLVVSADGSQAAISVADGRTLLVDLTSNSEPELLTHRGGARSLHIDDASSRLLISTGKPDMIWDLKSRTKVVELPWESTSAILSIDGRYIIRRESFDLEVRETASGKLLYDLPSFRGPITSVSVTDDLLLTASEPGLIHVWRLDTGAIVFRQRHGHSIRSAALSPDGSEYAISNGTQMMVFPIPRVTMSPDDQVERLRDVFDERVFKLRYILDGPTAP